MLSVVLTILKIIGIALLVIIGILLTVLCLVLFVPIRYKANGFYKESYRIQARLSWLLHIVSFVLSYEKDSPLHMKLRIFGIPVYDNLNKKEKKSKSPKRRTKKEPKPELVASSIPEEESKPVKEIACAEEQEEPKEELVSEQTPDENTDKLSLLQKLKLVFQKVIGIFRNIKYTFQRICDTIREIRANITYYIELWQKDSTRAALSLCKKQLLRIFKNLKPKKFQVNLHIGMEDSATLGDILGVWGMLYPFHQGHIALKPDFEQAVLEGEFYCKGRVTVYIYIWTVFMILFDKDIKQLRSCLVRKGK